MKTIRNLLSKYRQCLALKPAPQCVDTTPENSPADPAKEDQDLEEAPPRDESPPIRTEEVRNRFDDKRTPVEQRVTSPWKTSAQLRAAARYLRQEAKRRTTELVRHLAPDNDPSPAPGTSAPDTRVPMTPRSSNSPRVSEAPEWVPPESTVTYSRDEGESGEQSDGEGDDKESLASQVSVDETEVAARSAAPSPERIDSEEQGESSSPLGMESPESGSKLSDGAYQEWLIEARAQIWNNFAGMNPGWQPSLDGEESDADRGSAEASPDATP